MKEQVVNVLTNASILRTLVLATLVTPAQGQSLRHRIGANVPFGFIVADMNSRPVAAPRNTSYTSSSDIFRRLSTRYGPVEKLVRGSQD
jgi:hypothetical protein